MLREDRRALWRGKNADTIAYQVLPEHQLPEWEPWICHGIAAKGWVVVESVPVEAGAWVGEGIVEPDWREVASVLARTYDGVGEMPTEALDSEEFTQASQAAMDIYQLAQMQQSEVDATRLTVVPVEDANDFEDDGADPAG